MDGHVGTASACLREVPGTTQGPAAARSHPVCSACTGAPLIEPAMHIAHHPEERRARCPPACRCSAAPPGPSAARWAPGCAAPPQSAPPCVPLHHQRQGPQGMPCDCNLNSWRHGTSPSRSTQRCCTMMRPRQHMRRGLQCGQPPSLANPGPPRPDTLQTTRGTQDSTAHGLLTVRVCRLDDKLAALAHRKAPGCLVEACDSAAPASEHGWMQGCCLSRQHKGMPRHL